MWYENQIRMYVFAPYTLVKDLRTGRACVDVGAVLDGGIDEFLVDGLRFSYEHRFDDPLCAALAD